MYEDITGSMRYTDKLCHLREGRMTIDLGSDGVGEQLSIGRLGRLPRDHHAVLALPHSLDTSRWSWD